MNEPFVQTPIRWLGRLKPAEVVVAIAIGYHANRRGEAWPSIATIARMTGLARSTVKLAIARLVEVGVLTAQRRQHPKGGDTSHLYHIDLPRWGSSSQDQGRPDCDQGVAEYQPPGGRYSAEGVIDSRPGEGPEFGRRDLYPYEQHPLEPHPLEPQGGEPVCVTRAHARGGAADAAHTQEAPPRGFVLEIPRDLDWATGAIEAFWAAKQGSRSEAAATHLWEQLRAIATEGGPEAVLEQLRAGTANRWRNVDAGAWRRYKRRSGPGMQAAKTLSEKICEGAAAIEASLKARA